jgi:BlaR1 peptidase M56
MPNVLLYLLKCSISLSVVWMFYQLFLRRLTFYGFNRWYLLGYSLLSFLIPLIHIGAVVEADPSREPLVIQLIPAIGSYGTKAFSPAAIPFVWSAWDGLLMILALGATVLLIRSAARWLSLGRMRRHARLIGDPDCQTPNRIKIYQVDERIIPFSFGNAIYINQQLHTEKEWEEIILHEYVHIRQKHTLDILLAELFCICNWYNPFSWLIRYSIRQNLEFLADNKVLENGFDKKSYQYHLLRVTGEARYRLANNFNFSSLKKRIIMMNRIRSARLHLVKFLFILPLIAVLLVAFRDKYEGIFKTPGNQVGDSHVDEAGIVADLITRKPITGVSVSEKESGLVTTSDANGFYRLKVPTRNDSVRIHLDFHKDGYGDVRYDDYFASSKQSHGLVVVGFLLSRSDSFKEMFYFPNMAKKVPGDPSYEDALVTLTGTFQQMDAMNSMGSLIKKHPEVAMFYTTEDKEKHLVILKAGQVEKYGYPGGPGLAAMENKYGRLPEMMAPQAARVNKGYLSLWQKISSEAEKTFHTTNPDARQIIFPGDSRVLVVPLSGKPEIYDMDNADPKERPAFEKLYGKLPDFVPSPSALTHTGPSIPNSPHPPVPSSSRPGLPAPSSSLHQAPRTDTVPKDTDASLHGPARPEAYLVNPIQGKRSPLFVVDGVPEPAGWSKDSIFPADISSLEVIKGEEAFRLFGEKGINGVVAITTKALQRKIPEKTFITTESPVPHPLFVIDGKEVEKAMLDTLNPDRIRSINVLKDKTALAQYGEKGRNGVVLIQLKSVGTPELPAGQGRDSLGNAVKSVHITYIKKGNITSSDSLHNKIKDSLNNHP